MPDSHLPPKEDYRTRPQKAGLFGLEAQNSYDGAMEPPGITRHRRPFLAPVWLTLSAVVVLAVGAWLIYQRAATTLVFLVQPPEKSAGSIADPPISADGEARAQRLAHSFATGRAVGAVDALYVSDDRRAQQTAAPLAEALHRAPEVFRAAEARGAARRILRDHAGETVVVIASGAPLAQLVQAMAGVSVPAASADEPDVVYVVSVPTLGRAHLARLRL